MLSLKIYIFLFKFINYQNGNILLIICFDQLHTISNNFITQSRRNLILLSFRMIES